MTPHEELIEAMRRLIGPRGETGEAIAAALGRTCFEVSMNLWSRNGSDFYRSAALKKWFRSHADLEREEERVRHEPTPFGMSRCAEDETIFELTQTQIVMHGFAQAPTVGMMIADVLAEAERIGKRPTSTASRDRNVSAENIVYMLRGMVTALRYRIATGRSGPLPFCHGKPCDDATLCRHDGRADVLDARRAERSRVDSNKNRTSGSEVAPALSERPENPYADEDCERREERIVRGCGASCGGRRARTTEFELREETNDDEHDRTAHSCNLLRH